MIAESECHGAFFWLCAFDPQVFDQLVPVFDYRVGLGCFGFIEEILYEYVTSRQVLEHLSSRECSSMSKYTQPETTNVVVLAEKWNIWTKIDKTEPQPQYKDDLTYTIQIQNMNLL